MSGLARSRGCHGCAVIVKHGAGVENIDCKEAAARGVAVVSTPKGVTGAVAEYAVALMLASARRLDEAFSAARADELVDRATLRGVEVSDKVLGIVGFGRIGQRVAKIASGGLDMRIRIYDPYEEDLARSSGYQVPGTIEEMLDEVDFVSLHVPLTTVTRHLLDRALIGRLKSGASVINTARGGVIDEEALIEALGARRIFAALDVTETEPLPMDHPLRNTPNTILSPHVASGTVESLTRTAVAAATAVLNVLQGIPVEGTMVP